MKKRIFAALLALTLIFALPCALAAGARVESLEYKGFGVLEVELNMDCAWYPGAQFSLTNAEGAQIAVTPFGGDEEEAYLYAPEIIDGGAYSLRFALDEVEQSIAFTADTAEKYRVSAGGELIALKNDERCDFCRAPGHNEDFCPERIDSAQLPDDLAALARLFDVELCERCGGFGHDEDRCTGK